MMYGRLTVNPVSAAWNTVARFDEYSSAQRAVDWHWLIYRRPSAKA
jgi:hypothetical protein